MDEGRRRSAGAAAGASRSPGRRGRAALALLALLLAAAAAAALERRALAAWLLRGALERSGWSAVALDVTDVGPGGISLRGVRLGLRLGLGPALALDALDARWSVRGLLAGRLDALRAAGLRVRAELRDGALGIAGRGGPAAPPGAPSGFQLRFPLPGSLALRGARIDLWTPSGTFPLALDLQTEPAGAELRGELRVELDRADARASLALAVRGQADRWSGTLSAQATLRAGETFPLGARLDGEAAIAFRDGSLELRTPRCMSLRIERGELQPGLRLAAPLEACVGTPADGALRFDPSPEGGLRYDVSLEASAPALSIDAGNSARPQRIGARAPRVLARWQEGRLKVEFGGTALDFPTWELRGAQWQGSAELAGARLACALRVDGLGDTRAPARIAPLQVAATLEGSSADRPLDLHADFASLDRRLRIDASGTVEPASGAARFELRLQPIALGAPQAALARYSPLLARALGPLQGQVEALGKASFAAGKASVQADVALRGLVFAVGGARFTGVNGRIHFDGPAPFSTPPDQLLSAELTEIGLPLTDGLLRFRLRPDGAVEIQQASWNVAGGIVSTSGLLDFQAPLQEFELRVRGLQVAQIAERIPLSGLAATGELDGAIPLQISRAGVQIRGARLHARGAGGQIQYAPSSGTEALAGQYRELGLALGALENFSYRELDVTLDGEAGKTLTTGLHLRGTNPDFERGRLVEFNVNLEAGLVDLLRGGTASYRIPGVVEERLREFPGVKLR